MGQGRAGKVRVKKRGEEIERKSERRWVSVTSAITSSEMHLDTVSICQNKAASTAASLMAMDVSDRGVGEVGRDTQDRTCTHTNHTCTDGHDSSNAFFFFLCAANHWYQIYTKLQCNSYWTIFTLVRVRACAFARLIVLVSVCKTQRVHVYLPTVVFGCQILSTISHCDELSAVSISHLNCFFFFFRLHFFQGSLGWVVFTLPLPFSLSCCLCTRNIYNKSS